MDVGHVSSPSFKKDLKIVTQEPWCLPTFYETFPPEAARNFLRVSFCCNKKKKKNQNHLLIRRLLKVILIFSPSPLCGGTIISGQHRPAEHGEEEENLMMIGATKQKTFGESLASPPPPLPLQKRTKAQCHTHKKPADNKQKQ